MLKTAICGWSARGSNRHITNSAFGRLSEAIKTINCFQAKTLLVMKLTVILLTVCFLNVCAKGVSQHVSFSGNAVPLESVFSSVEKQTGFLFLYTESVLSSSKPVSVKAEHVPLEQFLSEVFKSQPLDYVIRGKSIFISARVTMNKTGKYNDDMLANAPLPIRGRVVDEEGKPLAKASISIKGGKTSGITNAEGLFNLNAEVGQTIIISYIGHNSLGVKITSATTAVVAPAERQSNTSGTFGSASTESNTASGSLINGSSLPFGSDGFTITLTKNTSKLEEVEFVVNTGYQKIKANEMVGAAEVVSKEFLNINTGMSVLDRLKGLSASVSFNRLGNGATTNNKLGITIRGLSTINGPADPLIVLDDFIYDGNINDINPNLIENITILKDAVATSIWGVRAANGVLVITTTKPKKTAKPTITFTSTTTVTQIPALDRYPSADTRSYIGAAIDLFNAGQYPGIPVARRHYLSTEPLLSVLLDRRKGLISAADSAARVEDLASVDYRDEYKKAFYQTGTRQNYQVNVNHASLFNRFLLSLSYTKEEGVTKEKRNRIGFDLMNSIKITQKLDFEQQLSFYNSSQKSGAPAFRSIKVSPIDRPTPYNRFYEEDGTATSYGYDYNKTFLDTAGRGMFMDWLYYPAEDWKHNYTKTSDNQLMLALKMQYRINNHLNLQVGYNFQHYDDQDQEIWDIQSYKARNIINTATQINYADGTAVYPIPRGDIITTGLHKKRGHSGRVALNYSWKFGRSKIDGLVGAEINSIISTSNFNREFGGNEDPLYIQEVRNFGIVKHSVRGDNYDLSTLMISQSHYKGYTNTRNISDFIIMNYHFDDTYQLYLSYRHDGANLFGVKTNDKWKPFWSMGANIDLKQYLKNTTWVTHLKLATTLGISGNIDQSKTAEAIAGVITGYDNIPYLDVAQVNNPYLRWEKSKQLNLGLAFGFFNNFVTGRFDYYLKRSTDLLGPEPFDYTNFYTGTITRNSSKLNGQGYELSVIFHPRIKDFGVDLGFSMNLHKDKIVYYNANALELSVQPNQILKLQGASPNAVMVYQFKGLNSEGAPQFYYKGENVTNPIPIIEELRIDGLKASSYKYLGSRVPLLSTTIAPRFNYKNLSLIMSMSYDGKHYVQFRNSYYPTPFRFYGYLHESYNNRWQKPGDELYTNIPGTNNSAFSESMLDSDFAYRRGDNIKMNGMNLSWTFNTASKVNCTLGAGVSNLGVIWSKEKDYVYRDFPAYNPVQKSYSVNLSVTF